jgi:hypothetical protein
MVGMQHPGQQVRVNLADLQVGSVVFYAAVTETVGKIVRQVSLDPPKYLVRPLFSFLSAGWTKWKCRRVGSLRSDRHHPREVSHDQRAAHVGK